ncbi:hypothetical protein [Candidatus Enterococcus murrayae]|uniref:Uncharacterized protein n=1 Tax=Candidatus Enterococcus murrayae TaxID=2815321 RepID=A0ABS3HG00_9ENTE|nr:hypothetical protein [Enterococcus sp. MJM16]MBO0451874.1 hypothetical protein [Enterococcus sp. MJM16]
MKKRYIETLLLIILLCGLFLSNYSKYSGLWSLRRNHNEIYHLSKRGYLKIIAVEELDASGMSIEVDEVTEIPLNRFHYFQGNLETYNQLGDSYNWLGDKEKIYINYCDEWDTLTFSQKNKGDKLFGTYEMLGDDGSYGKYIVEIK